MIGPAPELLDRRLLFFTGKGGVGKSTMAAATALLAADIGKRVLLVEVDAKGDVPAQFEQAPVGFTPREMQPGVLAMAMDTEASLQEYLKLNLRVPVLGRLGPLAKVLDFVATAAPGVKEILTIGKIAWEVRESIEGRADYDLVVVDAAATGHIVAQLGAADAIRELVDVGPLRSQTQWVSELLADPADHRGQHRDDARGDAGRGDDRARRAAAARGQRAARRGDREPRAARAVHARRRGDVRSAAHRAGVRAARPRAPGDGATKVLDAARLAVSLRRTGAVHLEHLLESVDLPLLYVPYLFVRGARVARHAHGRRRARRGAGIAMTAADRRSARRRSSSCSRRRRSWCSAVRAASARRRSRPRPRSARRCGSAARCSCSPSTRRAGSRPRSASKAASATARAVSRPKR